MRRRRWLLLAAALTSVACASRPPTSVPADASVTHRQALVIPEQLVSKPDPDLLPHNRTLTSAEAQQAMAPWVETPFVPSRAAERDALATLLTTLLTEARRGADDSVAAAQLAAAHAIGFELEIWQVAGLRYWALIELPSERRGTGSYVIRVGSAESDAAEIILQTPHVFFDRGTGDIASEIFFGPNAPARLRAFYSNTAHRYGGPNQPLEKRAESVSDLCHIDEHWFHTATEVAAQIIPSLVIIQLHGFADQLERPNIIISSGGEPTPLVRSIAEELTGSFEQISIFAEDIAELGGTQNAQRKLLQGYPRARFVHLELSAETRKALQKSASLMKSLGDVLGRARAVPEPGPVRDGELSETDAEGTAKNMAGAGAQDGPDSSDSK